MWPLAREKEPTVGWMMGMRKKLREGREALLVSRVTAVRVAKV